MKLWEVEISASSPSANNMLTKTYNVEANGPNGALEVALFAWRDNDARADDVFYKIEIRENPYGKVLR